MTDFNTSFSTVHRLQNQIEYLQAQLEQAKACMSEAVVDLRSAVGTPSFEHEGKYYSIRTRGDLNFLCQSDVPFGSWRKKTNQMRPVVSRETPCQTSVKKAELLASLNEVSNLVAQIG